MNKSRFYEYKILQYGDRQAYKTQYRRLGIMKIFGWHTILRHFELGIPREWPSLEEAKKQVKAYIENDNTKWRQVWP